MANLLELNTLVNSYCPNVPSVVVASALRECARDYFRQVNAYTVNVNGISTVADDPIITLSVDEDLEIVATVEVAHTPFDKLAAATTFPRFESKNKPRAYRGEDKRTLRLFPTPDAVYPLSVKVAVIPSRTTLVLDDIVLAENQEGLRYGTLTRLKSQPGTDWYSPNEVMYFDSKYQQEINQRRIELYQHEIQADPQTTIPFFA